MMMLFYSAAAIAVIATLGVISSANVVHALVYLIISLLAVAVIFFVLGAPFAAMLGVISILVMDHWPSLPLTI